MRHQHCDYCGKEIKEEDWYYKVPVLPYTCCSDKCLLSCINCYEIYMYNDKLEKEQREKGITAED